MWHWSKQYWQWAQDMWRMLCNRRLQFWGLSTTGYVHVYSYDEQPSDFLKIKKNHACTTKRNYLSDKNHHYGGFKELFELQKSSKMNTNYWLIYIQWTSYSAGLPARDRRGPLCYDCTEQQAADDCNRVTVCGLDYVRKLKATGDVTVLAKYPRTRRKTTILQKQKVQSTGVYN